MPARLFFPCLMLKHTRVQGTNVLQNWHLPVHQNGAENFDTFVSSRMTSLPRGLLLSTNGYRIRVRGRNSYPCGEIRLSAENTDSKRVPLTIVTGYLGAGKTILVKYMPGHKRVKVGGLADLIVYPNDGFCGL